MSKYYYTDEKNAQIVIALLKAHGIRRVVASPGATNAGFVWMLQNDDFFTIFSAVDERHAAYLAIGMAEESKEPVVISCTGATSSRNYMSGLTEAYYRKLPILAITSSMPICRLGQMWPQMTDRRNPPSDTVRKSIQCPVPVNKEDEAACVLHVNEAILELTRHGGGPVHINLETTSPSSFPVHELPSVRKINRICQSDTVWPELTQDKRVAIWIGSHAPFTSKESEAVERFAQAHNAVVFADRTSNYFGASKINPALLFLQRILENPNYSGMVPDLVVHIGEISGDYPTFRQLTGKCEVWRVNKDGELRDPLNGLSHVFEMDESEFFSHYSGEPYSREFLERWSSMASDMRKNLPDVPFSNIWIASQIAGKLSPDAEIHFGILNSLRSWNMFPSSGVVSYCNVGGFGIDGCVSSLIGASLVNKNKLFYGVFGDLAFFYDLNAIGNRHIGSNIRILVVNNGLGVEFVNPGNIGAKIGEGVEKYIAAEGHFGHQSRDLLKHLATDFGFKYLSAESKEGFNCVADEFLATESEKPILLECFVNQADEKKALSAYQNIDGYGSQQTMRQSVAKILPLGLKRTIHKIGI